ncbi:PK1L [Acrasis kona]|uniref:PK1L n=1 Tax=Acrasis kona TaxID=1008807 RepID=A0AAW2ZAV1_9EUKA
MTADISNPNVPHPILILILNFWLFGGVGYLLIGQQQKGIGAIVWTILTSWIFIGFILCILFAYDGYLIAQKLQAGQTVKSHEFAAFDFLAKLPLLHE